MEVFLILGKYISRYSNLTLSTRIHVSTLSLISLLVASVLVAISVGPVKINFTSILSILSNPFVHESISHTELERLIITDLRLPRIIVGITVGMGLSVAGLTMQALFRNPMADPGIIGVSAGGSLGAVVAITVGLEHYFLFSVPLFAFLGSLTASIIVYSFAYSNGRLSMPTLLLAGVAISAFFSSIISATIVLQENPDSVRQILFWLAGGLDSRSWNHVLIATPLITIGTIIISFFSRDLNLLSISDDDSKSLGVNVDLVRPGFIVLSSLLTGLAVSVSGTIIFVGLITPHILRLIVGPDHRLLVPLCAIGGAFFVTIADILARSIIQPAELQVGIITSLIGAPFFLFLLIKNKKNIHSY